MENPVKKAEELLASLLLVIESKKDHLATVPKGILSEAITQTATTLKNLKNVDQNYVPLNYTSPTSELASNLAVWNDFPGGDIIDKQLIKSLIDNSWTLKTLYKKGITISSIHKFDAEEIYISEQIAKFFFSDHGMLEKIKIALHKPAGQKHIVAKIKDFDIAGSVINNLKRIKLISEFSIERLTREDKWESIKENRLRWMQKNFPNILIRFSFDFTFSKPSYRGLLEGHWFNAYVYHIIYDHLTRNELDFEIYTRVAYEAPREKFAGAGDFDVLAMVSNKILLVECKSGRLREDSREVDKLINKTLGLKKVFDETGRKHEYQFVMICNPKLEISDTDKEKLAKAGIALISITDVRGRIESMFTAK